MPELFPDLMPFWVAFQQLSTSRQSGMGMGYIPLSEIRGYLDEYRIIEWEDRLEWIQWIQTIDRNFVSIHSESKNDSKKPQKQDQPGKGIG